MPEKVSQAVEVGKVALAGRARHVVALYTMSNTKVQTAEIITQMRAVTDTHTTNEKRQNIKHVMTMLAAAVTIAAMPSPVAALPLLVQYE